MRYFFVLAMGLCSILGSTLAVAQVSRGVYLEEISNERSSFAVRVDVNHADRVYQKDDLLIVKVESSEDGYLYLFYRDATGNVVVLFPNRYQQNNAIRKGEAVMVPTAGNSFRIRVDAPFGDELLKVVVSKKPLAYIDSTVFTAANATPVQEETAKAFSKSFAKETPDWAEHQVRIQTVESRGGSTQPTTQPSTQPTGNPPSGAQGKRFAVGIGISDYKDDSISKLGICHIDAEKVLEVFTQKCGVDRQDAILLANDKATLANIREVIKDRLPQMTKPGDVVFLFWSGHGGQTEDGKKEFLVPYDGTGRDISGTMLMDEMFGRWIQELDGRKVLIVLDACHSGGQAAGAKSFSKSLNESNWQPLRFAFTQLAIAKDVGQKDAALIASSTSSEVSFVRKERDLSVLTYYVLEALNTARGALTHIALCETIKPQVASYVEQNFTGRKQTVVMQDDLTEPLVLNP